MRFRSLGSGSGGNATLIEARGGITTSRVLVDCGFTLRELDMRLAASGLAPTDLSAIFVTHEHGDHIGCAVTLARRHAVPLWMSRGTWLAIGEPDLDGLLHFARDGEPVDVGDLCLLPYTVAHDAREPLQLQASDGAARLGVLTDAGSITPHLLNHVSGCGALLLECNHDLSMLAASRYPPSVKARIGGPYGHLSNDTAAKILEASRHSGLRQVVGAHLSRQNNHPDLVRQALAAACGGGLDDIVIADPLQGFGWLSVA